MKIALLGYGKEGHATEQYFKSHFDDVSIDIFENETPEQLHQRDYSHYDIIFRSPSIPPLHLANESSVTRYFFDHCPCPIIGVTATKGKGTTCSFIKSLLDAEGCDAYLVGNIGEPALNVLDSLTAHSVVVYEMSSFQLWDLEKSPHISVIGQLEPDHLNVHRDYADYLTAKSHITTYQTADDYCIYYAKNPESVRIAESSPAGHKIPYPFTIPDDVTSAIHLPGRHNLMNAIAAIAAVASYKNISPDEYLQQSTATIQQGLSNFRGLPHRLEFLRTLNGVSYYDDNFSTNPSSLRVAIDAFPDDHIVAIIGGRDKTGNQDLAEIYEILQAPQVARVILLGESGHEIARRYDDPRFTTVESLAEAITTARSTAESNACRIVLMSPSAASFDMFENVYDRGAQFKTLVDSLD
ncbi:UDP-N-acetylmuramoyl-L-alanine--D-glutamate ligase [Candidatus Saccharibacteria bacterium]|nr:UDP-N-acetylmuramoyl-L-alanine--D-glutamate ligase [Candidatus Saccharibacteria bacterium]